MGTETFTDRSAKAAELGVSAGKDIRWDSSRLTRKCLYQREVPEPSPVGGRELSDEASPRQV